MEKNQFNARIEYLSDEYTEGIDATDLTTLERVRYKSKIPISEGKFAYDISSVSIDLLKIVYVREYTYDIFGSNPTSQLTKTYELLKTVELSSNDYYLEDGALYFYDTFEESMFTPTSSYAERFMVGGGGGGGSSQTTFDHYWDGESELLFNVNINFPVIVPDTSTNIPYDSGIINKITNIEGIKPIMVLDTTNNEFARNSLAQTTQHAINDYFNLYTVAATNAMSQAELEFTTEITFTSTIISTIILLPVSMVSQLTRLSNLATTQVSKEVMKQLPKMVLQQVSSLVITPMAEVIEEIYVDSFIEAWIEGQFAINGGDEQLARFISMLVTSLREASNTGLDIVVGAFGTESSNDLQTQKTQLEQDAKLSWKSLVSTETVIGLSFAALSFASGNIAFGMGFLGGTFTDTLGVPVEEYARIQTSKQALLQVDKHINEQNVIQDFMQQIPAQPSTTPFTKSATVIKANYPQAAMRTMHYVETLKSEFFAKENQIATMKKGLGELSVLEGMQGYSETFFATEDNALIKGPDYEAIPAYAADPLLKFKNKKKALSVFNWNGKPMYVGIANKLFAEAFDMNADEKVYTIIKGQVIDTYSKIRNEKGEEMEITPTTLYSKVQEFLDYQFDFLTGWSDASQVIEVVYASEYTARETISRNEDSEFDIENPSRLEKLGENEKDRRLLREFEHICISIFRKQADNLYQIFDREETLDFIRNLDSLIDNILEEFHSPSFEVLESFIERGFTLIAEDNGFDESYFADMTEAIIHDVREAYQYNKPNSDRHINRAMILSIVEKLVDSKDSKGNVIFNLDNYGLIFTGIFKNLQQLNSPSNFEFLKQIYAKAILSCLTDVSSYDPLKFVRVRSFDSGGSLEVYTQLKIAPKLRIFFDNLGFKFISSQGSFFHDDSATIAPAVKFGSGKSGISQDKNMFDLEREEYRNYEGETLYSYTNVKTRKDYKPLYLGYIVNDALRDLYETTDSIIENFDPTNPTYLLPENVISFITMIAPMFSQEDSLKTISSFLDNFLYYFVKGADLGSGLWSKSSEQRFSANDAHKLEKINEINDALADYISDTDNYNLLQDLFQTSFSQTSDNFLKDLVENDQKLQEYYGLSYDSTGGKKYKFVVDGSIRIYFPTKDKVHESSIPLAIRSRSNLNFDDDGFLTKQVSVGFKIDSNGEVVLRLFELDEFNNIYEKDLILSNEWQLGYARRIADGKYEVFKQAMFTGHDGYRLFGRFGDFISDNSLNDRSELTSGKWYNNQEILAENALGNYGIKALSYQQTRFGNTYRIVGHEVRITNQHLLLEENIEYTKDRFSKLAVKLQGKKKSDREIKTTLQTPFTKNSKLQVDLLSGLLNQIVNTYTPSGFGTRDLIEYSFSSIVVTEGMLNLHKDEFYWRKYSKDYFELILITLNPTPEQIRDISWFHITEDSMQPNILDKKQFYNTFLELIQAKLDNYLFVEFKDILQGQFFTSHDGFTEHDKRLMEIMDHVLNKVFGYVGLLLLKMGVMSFTDQTVDDFTFFRASFMTFDHRYMTEITNLFGIKPLTTSKVITPYERSFFSDPLKRTEYLLAMLLSGYFQTADIVDNNGKFLRVDAVNTLSGDFLLSQLFLGIDKYNTKKTYHGDLKDQFLSVYKSWADIDILSSKRIVSAKQSLFEIMADLIDNFIITENIIRQWATLDPRLADFGTEAALWTELVRDWYKQQILDAIYNPRETVDPIQAIYSILTNSKFQSSIAISSRGLLQTFLKNNPILLAAPLFTEIDAINIIETIQFTHDHLELVKYQKRHLLKVDSVWSELMVPIITTFNDLYSIVSEYEGTLDKLTCRFYRLSSSGISNEDFINKYIKTKETENKFFFEIDLTSEETKRSGIISAIYYMIKFNSLLTITEGYRAINMAPYVLIASLDKIYDKEYLSTLTVAQLKVNFGATANAHYNNWKNSWNVDSRGLKVWTNKNRYPLYLFNDADLLEIDNILKDRFITLFTSTGMTNVQISNLLGLRYEV